MLVSSESPRLLLIGFNHGSQFCPVVVDGDSLDGPAGGRSISVRRCSGEESLQEIAVTTNRKHTKWTWKGGMVRINPIAGPHHTLV